MNFPISIIWVSSISCLGVLGVIFISDNEIPLSKQKLKEFWGYSVCLCPIKGMPGHRGAFILASVLLNLLDEI